MAAELRGAGARLGMFKEAGGVVSGSAGVTGSRSSPDKPRSSSRKRRKVRIAWRGLSHDPGRPGGEGSAGGGLVGKNNQQKSDSWYLGAGGAPLCPQVLHRCLWSRAATAGYPGTQRATGVSPTALASAQPFSKSNYTWHPAGPWWMLGNKDRNLTWFSLKVQRQQIGFLFFFFFMICVN